MKCISITIVTIVVAFSGLFYQSEAQGNPSKQQAIYTYHYESIGYSDIGKLYHTDATKQQSFFRHNTLQKISLTLDCTVKKTILCCNTASTAVAYQVIHPVVSIQSGVFPVNTEKINQELLHPVLTEAASNGKIKAVRIDSSISNLSANVLKEIVSRLQFVATKKNETRWQTVEENTTGTFLAKYALLKKENGIFVYQKKNEGYIKMASSRKEQHISIDSKASIITDTAGQLKSIAVSEAQTVLVKADTITASGSRIRIVLQSTPKAERQEIAYLESLYQLPAYKESVALSAGLSEDKINRMAYKNTLGNNNWNTLVQQLQMAAVFNNALKKDSLCLQFRALAYLYPETSSCFYTTLKAEPYHSFIYQVLTQALATTEIPSAINTLTHIIQVRKNEEAVLLDLLPVLATTSTPTTEAVTLVKELAFDTENSKAIQYTAQLALGGLACHYKKWDRHQSEAITKYIINHLETKDTIQKILVLGNTASPLVIPVLKSYIDNRNTPDEVRVAAINTLRFINCKEATSLLLSLLNSKNTALVTACKETIHFRNDYLAEK